MKKTHAALVVAAIALWGTTSATAEEKGTGTKTVKVVVATRDIAADEVVRAEDLAQIEVPEALVTRSMVKPDSASYIIDQKLVVPVLAGDLMLWASFEVSKVAAGSKECFEFGTPGKTAAEQVANMRARLLAPAK